jgi:uncharacterized phage-associated protein
MTVGYNVRKAAQALSLLVREQGDNADHIKTVKIIYLADRRFMELYDLPILNDDFVSMEHGPVPSRTYNFMRGIGNQEALKAWGQYIKPRQGNTVRLAAKVEDSGLSELSRAEIRVLKETVEKYKKYAPFDLVEYVHKNCREWQDVGKTSLPLPYERVFNALGKKNSNALTDRVYEYANMEAATAGSK